MALYRYFKPADDVLPSPAGHLARSVSPAAIKAANEAIRESALTPTSKSRGAYTKYTPAQQAMIGEYASVHGNLAAVRRTRVWGVVNSPARNAKIKTRKCFLEGKMGFSRKFGPAKISRYTVCVCTVIVFIMLSRAL